MMNLSKRFLLGVAVSAGAFAMSQFSAFAADTTKLTFLHINDVYEIEPNRLGLGGFAPLKTLIDAQEARTDTSKVMVTFGGDLLSPSILSGLTKGEHMIEFMNAIGTDLAVVGNHEFDFGPDIFETRISQSNFPWFGSNVRLGNGEIFGGMIENKIVEVDGFKVGFFGVISAEAAYLSSPGDKIEIAPFLEEAEAQVAKLKEAGADVIVALSHLDDSDDLKISKIKGIDIVLGGHGHDPFTFYDGKQFVHKSGTNAEYLGVVDIELERKEGRRGPYVQVTPSWQMQVVKNVEPNADVQAMVDKYNKQLDETLNIVIGETSLLLDSQKANIRTQETAMGNLISDALAWGTNSDIAFTNGGGIRGNREYSAGTKLTRKDILTELPFGNVTVVLEMTGKDVKDALENAYSQVEDKAGRFAHVSKGLEVVYDPSKPAGDRVVSISLNGQALDNNKAYRVATNDYIANGGDGYVSLKGMKRLVDTSGATLMATMVMNYVEANGTKGADVSGRVKAQ
ncbi:MAG: bifunctional UDP-sugar hydrolase/5'-nucleotidase [Alphaproteobacteria bacterium]|nr:bifunctional UDP-sugar hydrolase/5'-nucleotidase [Alphaproteobacteria bacterium]